MSQQTTAADAAGPDGAETTHGVADTDDQGLDVVARTSGQLVRRRFVRHRGALAGMVLLVFVVLLAFTSIGIGPIPGWWSLSNRSPSPGGVIDGGAPTLDLIPFLDGDGLAWGRHPFGQDNIGIDYFSLTMRGTQISLIIAFVVGIVSTIVGTAIGAVAGFYRGWVDAVLMRITDVAIIMPVLLVAAVLGRRFGNLGIWVLALALGLLVWTQLARLLRGEFLGLREKEFVEAAQASGASNLRIITKHILPNTLGVIIVSATLTIAAAILIEAAISFLGFGVRPPDTSLGLLISTYQSAFSTRPWLFWWPGIFIVLIALSVSFIGDGLRDAYDPKQNRVRN